jgi:sugar porter (SP) family MFS transporter
MRSWYGRGRPLRAAITYCCLCAFLFFGYDQGVFSGILQNKNWLDQFGHPDDTKTGILVSSYCLGALFGCGLNFFFGDRLGRRRMMWLAMCFVILGASLQTSAFSTAHLVIGRVITGFGTGIDSSTVPMYQSELCRKEHRGRIVSLEVLFIGIGITGAYWIDFGMSYCSGSIAWRLPISLQLVLSITVIILLFGLPESPRWLCKRGRDQEAIEVLCAVYDLAPDDPYVRSEMAAIRKAIDLERAEGASKIFGLFKSDRLKTRRRVGLAWFGLFMNQLSGINLVVYYMPSVLVTNVGLTAKTSQLVAGFIELMFIFGAALPSLRLDQMGRRKTMMWGTAGLSISMALISILLSFGGKNTSSAAIAFFFTYMLIFGATINVVPWVYGPEILPLEARARGTAISISSHWTWNFFIVMITPVLINRLGWKTYLIFTFTNVSQMTPALLHHILTSNRPLSSRSSISFTPRQAIYLSKLSTRYSSIQTGGHGIPSMLRR